MSRRNQNKTNSYNNHQYQYEHCPNMAWHGMYQPEHYEVNNDYNYYTTGKFKRRVNNGNVSGNVYYSNQNYSGYVSYDMPYWGYRNPVNNTNQHKDRRKRNPNYDNNFFKGNTNQNYNSNPNSSNYRQLVEGRFLNNKSNQAENSKKEAANFEDSPCSTISTGNAINVDENERPATRVISKKSLKENADFPNQLGKQIVLAPLAPSLHYTDYWLKHRQSDVDDEEDFAEPEDPCYVLETRKKSNKNENQISNKAKNKKQRPEIKKSNEFEKKISKMFTAPVEMSKGRSLLEKMGWKGGGLGKDGEGIVEPIAPKVYYAGTSMGLGQLTKDDEKPAFVDHVYLRTLKVILDFIKNDLEKELKFDPKLTPMERKRIHRTVQEMRDGIEKFPEPYKSVIMDIYHHNDYALYTESDGHRKTRHLTLYKEPHEHMYIIVPDDLNFEEGNEDCKVGCNEKENIKENKIPEASQNSIEMKSEENEATDDIICIKESNNVVENAKLIPQDKITVMIQENISRLENEAMEKDSTLIEGLSSVVDNVEFTQIKSTVKNEDNISQSQNEVMKNDNTFIAESSGMLDDVVITQEVSTFMDGENISQLETELNVEDNDDVNDRDGILNAIDDKENEEIDKGTNIENLQIIDEEQNQETIRYGKLENYQENVQNIHEIENNVNVVENNSIVKPAKKKLTKKQIRKLRAAEKIKANKINNESAKDVIHIKKKENNKKEVSDILDTIIKYFIEYTEDPLVTEFRFLGPFDHKERCAIKMFFDVCKGRHIVTDKSKEVLDLFDSDEFYQELRQDNNGRDVIFKIWKEKEYAINKE